MEIIAFNQRVSVPDTAVVEQTNRFIIPYATISTDAVVKVERLDAGFRVVAGKEEIFVSHDLQECLDFCFI